MTDRIVAQDVTEVGSSPTPGDELPEFHSEVLSRATFGASTARFTPETVVAPLPQKLATGLLAESLAIPEPPTDAATFLIEVLRRDTASSAIVAIGMDAFGDTPWPGAQRGVFAFSHDWSEPLVERLEWHTGVTRLASGNESRHARRSVPRRMLTYTVGNGRRTDAMVAEWLADHLGKTAWWPLPQYAARLVQTADRGASALQVSGADAQYFGPPSATLRLDINGLHGWDSNERWALIISPDGWQAVRLSSVASGMLWLADPLARRAAAGSSVMPLVLGKTVDQADFTQWVPGVAGVSVVASITPAQMPDPSVIDDPLLDGIPVWPDGNWRDDPTAVAQATIVRQDLSPADPWVRRNDPWATTTLQRRYLAGTRAEIDTWRARLWRTQGRLQAFWLLDGLAPILRVTVDADPDDGYLRVDGEDVSAFWHRPAACLIAHPDGTRQYAMTGTCHRDHGGVLVLRSGIDMQVPAGSRVIRLVRCRLDHDAVDLYWHSPTLMEITLTARQLPEPRSNSGIGPY